MSFSSPILTSIDASGEVLAVTATSGVATVASTDVSNTLCLTNTGTKTCYVRVSNSNSPTLTAVTTDLPVLAASQVLLARPAGATYVAAICGGVETTTLLVNAVQALY